MPNRRDFLTRTGRLAGFASLAPNCLAAAQQATPQAAPATRRNEWIALAEKLARPVLVNLAARTLRQIAADGTTPCSAAPLPTPSGPPPMPLGPRSRHGAASTSPPITRSNNS